MIDLKAYGSDLEIRLAGCHRRATLIFGNIRMDCTRGHCERWDMIGYKVSTISGCYPSYRFPFA